jgi:hypothetical protein
MNRAFILFFFLIISCKQQTREQKAEKIIRDHLFKTLHDFKSYEVVEFGKLDSLYSSVDDDYFYKFYFKQAQYFLDQAKSHNDNAKIYSGLYYYNDRFLSYFKKSKDARDSANYYIGKAQEVFESFKAAFVGWKMSHSYRSKALNGNSSINHFMYYFDMNLTKIVGHKDIGEVDDGKHEN